MTSNVVMNEETNQLYRECVKLCLLESVPHGGLNVRDIPVALATAFDELVRQDVLDIKLVPNTNIAVVFATKRAMFILSASELGNVTYEVNEKWKELYKKTGVVCLTSGPFNMKSDRANRVKRL